MRQYIEAHSIPEPNTGCWLWSRQLDKDGYGQFRVKYPGPWTKAHRASFEAFHGAVPIGLGVLHSCNVRCCVNPNHLYAGTQKDNVRDMLVPFERRIAQELPAITPRKHNGHSVLATSKRTGIGRRSLVRRLRETHVDR